MKLRIHVAASAALAVLVGIPLATATAAPPAPAVFTVTTTANSGVGSLRKAMDDAEANNNAPSKDRIVFSVPGVGPHSIQPTTSLPTITEPVVIDGYTQGDSTPLDSADDASENDVASGSTNAILKIMLDGSSAGGSGLKIEDTSDVVIRGLVVKDFGILGIVVDSGSSDVRIEGNFIGTDPNGTTASPNDGGGVAISSAVTDVTVGGTDPGDRNLISGNTGNGIGLSSAGAKRLDFQGNLIGTAADGTSDLGNSVAGVLLRTAPKGKTNVGGTSASAGNVIAFNGTSGVGLFLGGDGYSIVGNSIFSNDLLGIDIDNNGVTPNDPKDPDTGTNGLQNFPGLTSAVTASGTTKIKGKLNSLPKKKFTVQLFSSADADPSGNGEGKTLLGQVAVKTNKKGKASFTKEVPEPPAGEDEATATATNKATGDTSEFSATVPIA